MTKLTSLDDYLHKVTLLKQGITSFGKAPHKPVLLLSIIDLIDEGKIETNKIQLSVELVLTFKANWNLLVNTPHNSSIIYPFYYLTGDKFWHLISKDGQTLKSFIKSFKFFNESVEYAYFDKPFFDLLSNDKIREKISLTILAKYFPLTKEKYLDKKKLSKDILLKVENEILNNSYNLNETLNNNNCNEENQFISRELFRKVVPKVYNYECCITGMKIISKYDHSMIDACHIVPYSISKDNDISNGIALCPNLHRAFDRGLFYIDENYKVVVSEDFAEDETSTYSLRIFSKKQIKLPFDKRLFPKKENFQRHKDLIYKK